MSQIYNGSFVLGDTSATTLSAGPGIKLDTSVPGVIGISNDETVLWSGTGTSGNFPLTENPYNFEYIKIYGSWQEPELSVNEVLISKAQSNSNRFMIGGFAGDSDSNSYVYIRDTWYRVNNSGFNFSAYKASETVILGTRIDRQNDSSYAYKRVYKIVGVNRISGGN